MALSFEAYTSVIHEARGALLGINIRFKVPDLNRWLNAQKKIEQTAKGYIENEMQRKCAVIYANMVVSNILGGKHGAQTPPSPRYHEKYAAWKGQYFPEKGTWQLKGDLVQNVRSFKVSGGWMGGVPNGVMDSGGKSWFGQGDAGPSKSIAWYGKINESKRPIFGPTAREFATSDAWKIEGGIALQKVKKSWR
jgi:hypothetical protein